MNPPARFVTAVSLLLSALPVVAQAPLPEKNYLDKILERRPLTPEESQSLNRDADPAIDVRDLVIFLNGLPISVSFVTGETLAFHSQGSIALPVVFSKPVTGTVSFDLGGTAAQGAGNDFTLSPAQITLTNSRNATVTVVFQPWRGVGGEKVIRFSLSRQGSFAPANGTFPSHILRIRQFTAGEFVGMLSFPRGTGLPSLPVRVGLDAGGSAVCAFENNATLLGGALPLTWTEGTGGYPAFTGTALITLPGSAWSRTTDVHASLGIARLSPPFQPELAAYYDGFPADEKPALYQARFTFKNLFAAGSARPDNENPFAVIHDGQLTLRPVNFAADP